MFASRGHGCPRYELVSYMLTEYYAAFYKTDFTHAIRS